MIGLGLDNHVHSVRFFLRSMCAQMLGNGDEQMLMLESLLDEARAANDRLGQSIDALITEMAATREWARTAGLPYPTTPSAVNTDEQPLRLGPASRGPV